jgi:RHS repeat-associated protein
MRVGTARRVRARILRRALSTATALVLVATSITVPSVAAATAIPASRGTNLSNAAATNQLPAVTSAPTLPLQFVDDASGSNVSVRPAVSIPASPTVKTELASARTQYSRTYANPGGKYTLQSGTNRLNYKDANGAWQPIDTTLVAAPAASGWDYTEKANDKAVRISLSHPSTGLAQLAVGQYTVSLRVPGAATVSAPTHSSAGTGFSSPAGQFAVLPTPEGFDFSAVLASAAAPSSYAFALNTGGLVATLDADGHTVDLTDPAAPDPTANVGTIGAPTLFDSTSAFAPATAVTVSLSATATGLLAGETMLTYALDPAWLKATGRTYPVTLDPPLCIQVGYSGCAKNAGSDAVAALVSLGQESRSLFWFSMFALQDGAVISSASLGLEKASGDTGQPAHALTNLAGFDGTVTWATKPATTTTPQSALFTTCAGVCAMSLDVTDIVRSWYNRGPGFMANFGVTVKQDNVSANPLRIYGNSASPVSYRPLLTINYDLGAYGMTFDPSLGPDFAPSTTVASGTAILPIIAKNTSAAAWSTCASNAADCWSIGYRWYDAKNVALSTPSGKTPLPDAVAAGASTASPISVSIATPPAGQYTLRLDMVHTLNGADLWLSDWARKDLYLARAKASSSASNTHWAGSSVIERQDYPIAVVSPSGGGETKSVSLPDGGSLAINLFSRDISYSGAGGVGFSDLGGSVGLSYGYTASETNSLAGLLAAKGWYTNYDERIEPGTSTSDYTYRSASGSPSGVSANADGQLLGAPGRLDRPRISWFDENQVPGWGTIGNCTGTGAAPTYAEVGAGAFSGTKVLQIAANNAGTCAPSAPGPTAIPETASSPSINLDQYANLLFEVKTDSDTGAALGMYVTDKTTGISKWFYYTVGANWTIGGGALQVNVPISPVGTWATVAWTTRNGADTEQDVATAFGASSSDTFLVSSIKLLGRGGLGNVYFDDIRFEGRVNQFWDTTMPTWTSGSASVAADHDPAAPPADTFAVKVAATSYANSPDCSNCYYGANRFLGLGLNPFPFGRWSWRKSGGKTIAVTFHLVDPRTSVSADVTYYAGPVPPAGAPNPIQVSPTVPTDWTPVTRNVLEDARGAFGFYNSADTTGTSTSPDSPAVGDAVSLSGFRLVAGDGAYGLFDLGNFQSMPNVGLSQNGAATGDDFILTLSGGETHRFNRDGVLTSIADANGNATRLTYTYDTSSLPGTLASTSLRYTLTSVIAPSDGMPLAGSATPAVRRINVTYPASASCGLAGSASCVRFTEALGSGSDTGRYTEFDLNALGDVVAVIPARISAPCATTGASGCAGFVYDAAHRLTQVNDPRYPAAATDYTTITWSGTPLAPNSIADASTGATRLAISLFANGAPAKPQRVAWRDASSAAAGLDRIADLGPGGSIFKEYAPVACGGDCSAVTPGALIGINQSDGDANLSGSIRLRTAPSGCAIPTNLNDYLTGASVCGSPIVTRRGTYAAYAMDNYSDPLTGGLTDWSQSADQFAASVASHSADRYRTIYQYNALGQTTDTIVPSLNQTSTYSSSVLATNGLAHYYRMADTGTTMADSVATGKANGTLSGSIVSNAATALVNDPDKSLSIANLSTGSGTASPAAISGTFSVEAWFNLNSGYDVHKTLGIMGSRAPSSFGFDIKLMPNNLLHADIGNGTSWLTTTADAKLPYAVSNWYQVVYVVTPTGYSIYVNGASVGAGAYASSPLLFDANHKLYVGWTGYPAEYWQGGLDELSIYTAALTPDQIAAHYAAAGSTILRDQQVVYDAAGNPTQALDNFLANPGFESSLDSWTTSGATINAGHYPDPGTANQQSVLLAANGTAAQTVSLLAGQTFRLQSAFKEITGAAGKISIDYQQLDGTWTTDWQTMTDSNTAWHLAAWDVTLPMESTGQVKVTFKNTGASSGFYVDDVALFTTYKATTYDTHGLVQTVTEVSGASGANATTVSTYDYGAASGYATNLLANGGFTNGTTGWTLVGTATTPAPTAAETLRDGDTIGTTLAGPWGSTAKVTLPSGSSTTVSLDQSVAAAPGTSYSVSGLVANGGLTATYLRLAFKTSGGTVLSTVVAPSTARTGGPERSGWAYETATAIAPPNAASVLVSVVGTGAGASFYADQVRLFASATPAPFVADAAVTPAIFATRVTRNVVSGGTAPDQNVASVSAYDRWGRSIVSIDPDGIGTMSQFAANQTDTAASSDGLGNVSSTTSWDAVGNATSVTDPAGFVTATTYNYANAATDTTTAAGTALATTSHTDYDTAGRQVHAFANYVNGGSGQGTALDQNLESAVIYDDAGNGWVKRKVADDGGIAATTDMTYDLQGTTISATVYPGAGGTGTARTTTSHFDKAGNATGSQAAIAPTAAPAPLCPDSATQYCNSITKLDLNGRALESIDVYGHVSHSWYDIAGQVVRTISNYAAGGAFSAVANLTTDSRYDLGGRPLAVSAYVIPCGTATTYATLSAVPAGCVYVANTAYDALGRSLSIVKPDRSWTHTVYTKAGRVDRTSRAGGTTDTDSTVAWTRNLYDAAGRQTTTISDYDTSGSAGLAVEGFEGDSAGWDAGASASYLSGGPSSISLDAGSTPTVHTGTGSLLVTTTAANQGTEWTLPGTYQANRTYHVTLWLNAASGTSIKTSLGVDGGNNASVTTAATGAWQKVDLDWAVGASAPAANTVKVAVATTTGAATFRIDDVSVWDTGARAGNKPNVANVPSSVTVFDARGQIIESISAPATAGEAGLVTTSAFDALGRMTSVTVNANPSMSGANLHNGSAADTNLLTTYSYDGLGRKTDTTDPAGHVTHLVYDRMGNVIEGDVAWGDSSNLGIRSLAAYDALGELLATCTPNAVAAGCSAATITTSTLAWRYAYDAMGHQTSATPPVNAVATAMATTTATYDLAGAGHLSSSAQGTARTTTAAYDAAGRQTTTVVAMGGSYWSSANTLDSLGRSTAVATTGTTSDKLLQTYDATGRLTNLGRYVSPTVTTPITAFAYNPDGTASARTDYDAAGTAYASTYEYTFSGSLASATMPGSMGTATYTWNLDGNLATRTWGANISGTYGYDGSKRPISLSLKFGGVSSGTISRSYDLVGNALTEGRTLSGAGTGLAGSSAQSFVYDAAGRLTSSYFGPQGSPLAPRTYEYDHDSNRTTVTESGVTFHYFFDTTDELTRKSPGADPNAPGSIAYVFDALGQMKENAPSGPGGNVIVPTSYQYDPAGHLTCISASTDCNVSDTTRVTFTLDALGRHASQTIAATSTSTTYAYLGTANQVVALSSGATTTFSAIDAIGDRLTSGGTGSGDFAYLVPDLHGTVVATISAGSGPQYLTALAYDAYGQTCDSYNRSGNTLDTPWRYQGRIRESASGSPELYDFSARSYDPSLGAFTSFDSVSGSALNPLTLNRYLYANGNPATMVDPSGHYTEGGCVDHYCPPASASAPVSSASAASYNCGSVSGSQQAACAGAQTIANVAKAAAGNKAAAKTLAHDNNGDDMASSIYSTFHANTDMGTAVWNQNHLANLNAESAAAADAASHACHDLLCGIDNWVRADVAGIEKQMPAMLWLGAIATCAIAWEAAGLGCIPLAGLIGYTGANTINNAATTGRLDVASGWNWKDAAVDMAGSTAAAVTGGASLYLPVLVGGAAGFVSDVVQQNIDKWPSLNLPHAVCAGIGGAYAGGMQFGGGPMAKAAKAFAWEPIAQAITGVMSAVFHDTCGS